MGYVIQVVFGFEYTSFIGDSMCSATFVSQSFYTEGVDMDCWFQIWSTQSWNNIHPFKPSARLYQRGGTSQRCELQVHMLITVKKWKKEIVLSMLG